MNGRTTHEVEQALSRPLRPAAASKRRSIFLRWQIVLPLVVLALAVFVLPLPVETVPEPPTVTYTQLLQRISAGRVESIAIEPGIGVHGRWSMSVAPGDHFTTAYPAGQSEALVERAEKAGVTVVFRAVANDNGIADLGMV